MAGVLGTISGQIRLDVKQAVAAYATVRAQNARTVYALRGAGDSFVQAGNRMTVAGGAMVYGFARAVQAAAEFERKMDFASAVSDTTGAKMQKLSDYALKLGQDTIYSAGEIADGFIELAKAGVDAEQIIGGIGEAMANLGAAGDIPLAQSGQIITSTIQQYDLAASDAVKVTDLLAGAANASIADISDIGVSLKYVGGVANAAGLTFEDTATAISLLAKAGIRGSTAGTSLRQMIVSLGGATGPARSVLEELGIITEDGANKFFTAEGKAKSLSQVYQILQDATADLTQKERLMALRTIFNNRALSAASILTRDGAKGFAEMNAEMSKTTAADVARERLDNLSGDIEILRGNFETLMVKAGGPFQETLRGWVQGLTAALQAFADLDPGTQKFILQTVALTGVFLAVSGVILTVVGVFLRMLAGAKKLAAGISFVFKVVRGLLFIFGLITGGAITGTFLLIAGAVIAVGAAFVLAYKKIEPFRNFINGIGSFFMDTVVKPIVDGIQALFRWFGLLVTNPRKAWDQLVSGAANAAAGVGRGLGRIGSEIGNALSGALSQVGSFVGRAVSYIASLPGRALSAVVGFVVGFPALFADMAPRVLYAIGYMVGAAIQFLATLPLRMLELGLRAVNGFVNIVATLGPKVAYFIGFMIGRAIGLLARFAVSAGQAAFRTVMAIIRFIRTLPARVGSFLARMVAAAAVAFVRFIAAARRAGPAIVNGIINFLRTLPSRVATLFVRVVTSVARAVPRAASAAKRIATSVFNGLMNGIRNLPSAINGVLDRVISAFTGIIGRAYRAARDAAASLWKGFKNGIGMNSPSYFEKAMWQITGTVADESKRLGGQLRGIQRMSRQVNAIPIIRRTEGEVMASYAATRRMGQSLGNQNATFGTPGGSQVKVASSSNVQLEGGKLELINGDAYIRDIAISVVDDNDEEYARAGRRGGR